jgi:predicted MPP superfamily phosphohydrolase
LGDNALLKYIFEKFIIIFSELIYFMFEREKQSKLSQKFELKFKEDGTFKIVQFTDLHERLERNENTLSLMKSVLKSEKPDLVILTGDCIDGRYCRTREAVENVIHNIASVMEENKVPWAVALGNHDCEFCSVNREQQMEIYMSYSHNLSQRFSSVIARAGDYNILINDFKGSKQVFNIFMMDSGDYCFRGYDYITRRQIHWYEQISHKLEKRNGKKIPSLMFFHIPLRQQKLIGKSGKINGVKNESECIQAVDRGLFKSLKKIGNVKGVFCGHDHTNDYVGCLDGIKFGYGRCSGYNGYNKEGLSRGARVFVIDEKNLEEFNTYVVCEE